MYRIARLLIGLTMLTSAIAIGQAQASAATPAFVPGMTNQCSTPQSARVGHWTCQEATAMAVSPMSQTAGYCEILSTTPGCWTLNAEEPASGKKTAYFNTKNGAYGWLYGDGPKQVGRLELDLSWQAKGSAFLYWANVRNSHATQFTDLAPMIQNGAVGVDGSTVAGDKAHSYVYRSVATGKLSVEAGGLAIFKNLYLYNNEDSIDTEAVTRVTWWIPGDLTQDWWMQVKSPVVHTRDFHTYYFSSYKALPKTAWQGGHDHNEVHPGGTTR